MENKKKFIELLIKKKLESNKSTAEFLDNKVSESVYSKFINVDDYNFVNREIYKVPCVLFQHDGRSMHGIYSCTKVNSNQKELFNLNTFDKIDIDFAKVTEIYPIDCAFAPKT